MTAPMKFLPLIWAGIWRRPGRTTLTFISVTIAFVLFGLLQGFSAVQSKLIANAHADVLLTSSRIGRLDPLPLADLPRIQRVPGVVAVAREIFCGGPFREPTNFIAVHAIDPSEFQQVDVQTTITPQQWAVLKGTKSGALAPQSIAMLNGWKVGDDIPLTAQRILNRDGTHTFPVTLIGIYPDNRDDYFSSNLVLLNYSYIDEARDVDRGTVNDFAIRVASPAEAGSISTAIDALFLNSDHPTKTYSLRQIALAAVEAIEGLGVAVQAITGAVFFALLFSMGAVMFQAGRERIGEFALLKTLGFTDGAVATLVVCESLAFCIGAASVGLVVSLILAPAVAKAIGYGISTAPTMGMGYLFALVLGLLSGSLPAWQSSRLRIVNALMRG